ncbi:transcriptional regulator [Candidatus Bathyarchaeota archaeon]|nr:transcriptional regulator [Candidatus Bathyarchaeota archaeon]
MNDKGLGILIIVFSIIFMVGYFIWAFAPLIGLSQWITKDISEWAFKLPVVIAIYAVLILILWIGYTMATTPPPIPLEKPLEIEREKASGIKEKRDKET